MFLRAIANAFPEREVLSTSIAEKCGLDPAFVTEKIGVEKVFVLNSNESTSDLAEKACRSLFEANPDLSPASLSVLILVTQNPDYRMPHTAALLQHRLGLPKTVATFDINLGCSGFVYGLSVIKGFMESCGMQNGILVTCDPYSKIMSPTDRNTAPIFGDSATASWISADQGARIGRPLFGTDGGGAEHLIVKAGGSAYPLWDYTTDQPVTRAAEDLRVRMDGRAIFNFMIREVPKSLRECLSQNGVGMEEVDFFVFHQASRFLLETLRQQLHLPAEKVPIGLTHGGNTVSSSIPNILHQLLVKDGMHGKKVFVSGFGVGLSWASNVLYFDPTT